VDLSIIIVNWKSAAYLKACLTSIVAETRGITYEVIVIDNASHDGCEQIVRDASSEAIFVQSAENLGFGRANNLAAGYSSGDVLLFLNPDTKIVAGAIQKMVAALKSDSHLGAVGALLLNDDGSIQSSCVQAFPTIANQLLDSEVLRTLFPRWSGWGLGALLTGDRRRSIDVDVISGAAFMVKRRVFALVGGFESECFMYADDVDLSFKIRKAGYRILCVPECRITHFGGRSSANQINYFAEVLQRESMAQFFLRTRGRFYATLYRIGMAATAAIRLALISCSVVLERRASMFRLRKWSRIFAWAVGAYNVPGGGRTDLMSQV
jgi:GT2 family glycosyltransferase